LFLGTMLGLFVCPVVKRIWTPSWVLFSGGWVLLMLAAFYWVVEVWGWRKLVFPLVVVGMNSIFIYVMSSLSSGWIRGALKAHLPEAWTAGFWGPVVERCGVLAVLWLLCFWLYRQRAFLRL
jgi:predicted acyltransferase